jgi:hypothetical protein
MGTRLGIDLGSDLGVDPGVVVAVAVHLGVERGLACDGLLWLGHGVAQSNPRRRSRPCPRAYMLNDAARRSWDLVFGVCPWGHCAFSWRRVVAAMERAWRVGVALGY